MFRPNLISILAAITISNMVLAPKAFSQASTTLYDPLIPGASSSLPFVPPPNQPPPAAGSGPTPLPVTPGMGGPSTLLPWVPNIPATDIDTSTSGIGLPVAPSIATPPGALGPMLTPFIPNAPSTPGNNPGILTSPQGYVNPAQQSAVNPAGGLPGTGGYNTSISQVRRGGQHTAQYEERGRSSVLGGGGTSQDEVTQFGPLAGFGVPYGVPSGNAYNNGVAGSNNDNRNSAIDMGGGQRFKVGGVVIPMGQTLQDAGDSATRNNAISALGARQSTEFGQGLRREPIHSNTTTDFGFPYKQFAANAGYQKTGQKLNPNAILTNF